MTETGQTTASKLIEIRLRSGANIKARLDEGARPDLADLHRELGQAEFVRVGDNTVVRSSDVEYLQLREDDGGLLDSLKSRVAGGGSDGGRNERPSAPETRSRPRPRGPRRLIETRPFFLTSEFVLALAAWVALLLTTLATDSLDAWGFTLLTVAICAGYMLSRGFAKAHAPSEAWDPREELRPSR
jgi:hypothetical protein